MSTTLHRHALLTLAGVALCCIACGSYEGRREVNTQSTAHTLTTSDGLTRSYTMLAPDTIPAHPALVLVLHGGGGTGTQMMHYTRLGKLATERQFIGLFPDGIDEAWNDGRPIEDHSRDDVLFLTELIEEVATSHDIARDRVYITGISNGGFMAARMLCERPELFAGAAFIASGLTTTLVADCAVSAPVELLIFKGTDDPLVPFEGGPVASDRGEVVPTSQEIAFWAERNGCDAEAITRARYDLDPEDGIFVEQATFSEGCAPHTLSLYKAVQGGHTWPGNDAQYAPQFIIGTPYNDVDASQLMLRAFDLPSR